jgi:hypothetical protein
MSTLEFILISTTLLALAGCIVEPEPGLDRGPAYYGNTPQQGDGNHWDGGHDRDQGRER